MPILSVFSVFSAIPGTPGCDSVGTFPQLWGHGIFTDVFRWDGGGVGKHLVNTFNLILFVERVGRCIISYRG